MAQVIIVSNHEIWAAGLSALLRRAGQQVIATCARTSDLATLAGVNDPDILILRRELGAESIRHDVPLDRFAKRPRLVLVVDPPVHASELVAENADGIVVASPNARPIAECIESVARGIRWVDPDLLPLFSRTHLRRSSDATLTPREYQIVQCVARGLRNKVIARELSLSEGTVKMHLHHIFEKLKLHSRTELALWISKWSEPGMAGSSDRFGGDLPNAPIHASIPVHASIPDVPHTSRFLQLRQSGAESTLVGQGSATRTRPFLSAAE